MNDNKNLEDKDIIGEDRHDDDASDPAHGDETGDEHSSQLSYNDFYISSTALASGTSGSVFSAMLMTKRHKLGLRHNESSISTNDLVVKQVKPGCSQTLQQEFSMMVKISHPNILRVFTHFPHPFVDNHYMVMKRMNGLNLEHHMARYGVFNEADAIQIMVNLLSALSLMHSRGVGHLDIKPSNIMFRHKFNACEQNIQKRNDMCLVDFGLAMECPHPLMLSSNVYSSIRGTPVYAAPEVSSGSPYAIEKADIWSCGITLFELLSGVVPYVPENESGGFSAVSEVIRENGPINNLYSDVDGSSSSRAAPSSPNCRRFLQSCLQMSSADRPTAIEALEMLRDIQNGSPTFERGIT